MIDRCQNSFQVDGAAYGRDGDHPTSFSNRGMRLCLPEGELLLRRWDTTGLEGIGKGTVLLSNIHFKFVTCCGLWT